MKSFTFGPEATEVVTDVTEVSGSWSLKQWMLKLQLRYWNYRTTDVYTLATLGLIIPGLNNYFINW